MHTICEFLNLEFDPEMLQPYEKQSEKMTDGIHAETRMIGDIGFHEHRDIDPSVADRWKQHQLARDLNTTTWGLAQALGYAAP